MSVLSSSAGLLQNHVWKEEELLSDQSFSNQQNREESEPLLVKEEEPGPPQVKEEPEEPGPPQVKQEPAEFSIDLEEEKLLLSRENPAVMLLKHEAEPEEASGVPDAGVPAEEETDDPGRPGWKPGRNSHTEEMDAMRSWMSPDGAWSLYQDVSDGESDGGEELLEEESDDPSFSPSDQSSTEDEELEKTCRRRKRPRLTEPPPPAGEQHETARDGTVWRPMQPGPPAQEAESGGVRAESGGVRAESGGVRAESGGPTLSARCSVSDPLSAFLCLMDPGLLQHICDCSVAEARLRGEAAWDLNPAELKAFLALLLARGVQCAVNVDDLWSHEWGLPFFTTTMPRNRFKEIMRYLQLQRRGGPRPAQDRFAMVSPVWERLLHNSRAAYRPGARIAVGEQLLPTKSRCPFSQFVPHKPGKFGIKFWLAADAHSKFLLNGAPYLGKEAGRPGEALLLRLVEPFLGEGRSVTAGSFFTSLALANKLLARSTSLVGCVKLGRRFLPPSVHAAMGTHDSRLLRSGSATLTVYRGAEGPGVCILSTMHASVHIRDNGKRTPETVRFFRRTSGAVEALERMLRRFSTRAGTRRWPVAVFYNILDMAALNAWVLFRSCTGASIPRRVFILELCKLLRHEHVSRVAPPPPPAEDKVRRICGVKRRCKKNKAAKRCAKCQRAVCGQCTVRVHVVCADCE